MLAKLVKSDLTFMSVVQCRGNKRSFYWLQQISRQPICCVDDILGLVIEMVGNIIKEEQDIVKDIVKKTRNSITALS